MELSNLLQQVPSPRTLRGTPGMGENWEIWIHYRHFEANTSGKTQLRRVCSATGKAWARTKCAIHHCVGKMHLKAKGNNKSCQNPSLGQVQLPIAAPHALLSHPKAAPGGSEVLAPCPEGMQGVNIPSKGCSCPAPGSSPCCSQGRTSIPPLLKPRSGEVLQHKNTSSCTARRPLTRSTSALIMNHHLINIVSAASWTPWEEKQGRKPLETSVLPLSIAPCAITAHGLRSCATPWGKKMGTN